MLQDRSDIDHFNKSSSPEADFKRGAYMAHLGSDRTHEVSNKPDTNPVLVSSTSKPTKIRSTGTEGILIIIAAAHGNKHNYFLSITFKFPEPKNTPVLFLKGGNQCHGREKLLLKKFLFH